MLQSDDRNIIFEYCINKAILLRYMVFNCDVPVFLYR